MNEKEYLPHQQRVVVEKSELDEKISKLVPFLTTDIFKGLDVFEQNRLVSQADVMRQYSNILGERIANF